MVEWTVRQEVNADFEAISRVIEAAFADIPHSDRREQFIVSALRRANALTISLVVEIESKIVGHIAFSPVTISDGSKDWYGLGPIAVLPQFQRRGIGKSLISEGLKSLKNLQAKGCLLVGNPDYYQKFGFKNFPHLIFADFPPKYLLALPFDRNEPRGTVLFHQSFMASN